MSHFTVLVIGDDIDGQLAPFQENNMGDCPKQYLEFNDEEDEMLKNYQTDKTEVIIMPDGRKLSRYDEAFRNPGRALDFDAPSHIVPEGLKITSVPLTEVYATFDEYAREYHGKTGRDEAKGRYGYWENPNAKWDWFLVGGRWTGFFKLKLGRKGKKGKPGVMTPESTDPRLADTCLKRDIDIEGMRRDAGNTAADEYDFALSVVGDLPVHESWEIVRGRHEGKIDDARKEYHDQPRILAWKKAENEAMKSRTPWPFGWRDAAPDLLLISRDEYIAKASARAMSTHSVIKDGKWYERGTMGWWGHVHNEKDEETWVSMFKKLIDELPDDARLTVVDCHI